MVATTLAQTGSDTGFDPSVIESLAGIMSESAMNSLLADLVRDARFRLERVAETNVCPTSLKVIAQDAHDLKSMGGNFGLVALATCAGVVERAARGGCTESVRDAMPSLIKTGRKSLKTIVETHKINCERAS